ncbi:MAG: Fur family transcriptional regulator [Clostridiales bacterium]
MNNDIVEEKLKDFGYKLTPQRKLIGGIIKKHEGEHLSIEEIHELVKKMNEDIGLATVYRTVSILVQIGLVLKVDFDDSFSRYEYNSNLERHVHHHLICLICDSVKGIDYDLLGDVENKISATENFVIKNHIVKFYGYCNKCMEKKSK